MRNMHKYEELFPDEFEAEMKRSPIIYLSCAPVEYHGPHVGPGMDLLKGYDICLRAAEISGGIVYPVVPVAPAGNPLIMNRDELRAAGHVDSPGVFISADTCRKLYNELLEVFAEDIGFKVCVIMGSHSPAGKLVRKIAGARGDVKGMKILAAGSLTHNSDLVDEDISKVSIEFGERLVQTAAERIAAEALGLLGKVTAGNRKAVSASRKTLDEHKDYIEQLCRISFFYAGCLKELFPEERAGLLLRKRTPLFSNALNLKEYMKWENNPECMEIEALADGMADLPVDEFEERLYVKIRNKAMDSAEKFYPESVGMGIPPGWNVRSLKYDPPRENLPPGWCNFHITNWMAPKSFFDDPRHLPECFIELMEKSEKEYGYDTLHTSTWLNDNPHWLVLFPEEWHANLSPREKLPGWDFGYWGQMATKRGTFNYKAGEYLRTHKELRYNNRASHCSFSSMRRHLYERLNRLDKL